MYFKLGPLCLWGRQFSDWSTSLAQSAIMSIRNIRKFLCFVAGVEVGLLWSI